MSKWPLVPLGEVANFDRKGISPEAIRSGTKYVGLENIAEGGDLVGVLPVDTGDLASSKFEFTRSHVLYGKLRPYLRKIARPEYEGICSTDIVPILPGPEVDRGYLTHFLRLDSSIAFASDRAVGVNLPRISPSVLATLPVPLPALQEQRRIAAILDQAEALRAKRRQALAKLDTLTQSLFLEIFGDPLSNSLRWPVRSLGSAAAFENGDRSSNYPSGNDLKSAGVIFLSGKNIVDDSLNLEANTYIDEAKFNSLSRGKAQNGDLIITLRGTLGSCCVFECEAGRAFINAQMMIIRPSQEVNATFLHALLTSKRWKAKFQEMSSGVAVPQLTAAQLRAIPIIIPSKVKQDQFSKRLRKFKAARSRTLKALDSSDSLFLSIQTLAFRGEL